MLTSFFLQKYITLRLQKPAIFFLVIIIILFAYNLTVLFCLTYYEPGYVTTILVDSSQKEFVELHNSLSEINRELSELKEKQKTIDTKHTDYDADEMSLLTSSGVFFMITFLIILVKFTK